MLQSISLRSKLIVLPILLAITMLGEVALVTISLKQNHDDALIINIAGRQRMLTKKFSAEELHKGDTRYQHIPESLHSNKTAELYKTSLDALMNGGSTYSDLAMKQTLQLPNVTFEPFIKQLKEVRALWEIQYKAALEQEHNHSEKAVNDFLIANHNCMLAMNKAVVIYAKHADDKLNSLTNNSTILAIVMLLLSLGIAWVIIRSTTRPVNHLVTITRKISEGDLKPSQDLINIISRNELGLLAQHIEIMRQSLETTLNKIQKASSSIELSSSQVSVLSQQISQANLEEQQHFSMVTENSNTLEESTIALSEIVSETLQMVTECNELSNNTSALISNNITNMVTTADETNKATSFIQELSQTAEKVYGIVDAIRAISEQTNLLALNAAIEAARAGEQGRGFAVVADEVRSLAARTGSSTNEISDLISQLTDGVQQVVNSMGEVANKVEESRETSMKSEQGISQVTEKIQLVAQAQKDIDTQVENQNKQLTQLKSTQSELQVIIAESHNKSETSSLVANQLSSVSENVSQLIQTFSVDKTIRTKIKKTNEKRDFPRLSTGLHFNLKQGNLQAQGLSENISLGGIKLMVPSKLNLDPTQPVNLTISYLYNGINKQLNIQGAIIKSEQQKTKSVQIHIRFDETDDKQLSALNEIFEEQRTSAHFDNQ